MHKPTKASMGLSRHQIPKVLAAKQEDFISRLCFMRHEAMTLGLPMTARGINIGTRVYGYEVSGDLEQAQAQFTRTD